MLLLLSHCIKTSCKKERGMDFFSNFAFATVVLLHVVKTVVPLCLTRELILQLSGQHSLSTACRLAEWSVCHYSATDSSAEYCDEHVCLCVSVHDHISTTTRLIFTKFFVLVTCGRGLILLWQRSDTLRISGFMDDVMFTHKLIGCSTSPPGWGSEANMYAALGLARRNTRCRQQMLASCSQSLLGRSGHVEYL